jgi:hypothetical protein
MHFACTHRDTELLFVALMDNRPVGNQHTQYTSLMDPSTGAITTMVRFDLAP